MLALSAIVAFALLGALWLAAVLHEHGLKPMRKLSELMKRPAAEIALVALVAIGMIHHGATKSTNGMQMVGGNLSHGANENTEVVESGGVGSGGINSPTHPLTHSPTANYLTPTTNSDWLAFGGYKDWFCLDGGGWCFRFGSNLVERLTVFSCGEISSAPYDASNRISLLGLPLSVLPAARWHMIGDESLFCHSETPSNTLLLTWQNALVDRDTNLPVTVQAELFPDGAAAFRYGIGGVGDIVALSNAEAQIVRDGVPEAVPLMTGAVTLVEFAAPAIAGTNALEEVQARIAGGNSNAYYCADVVVSKGPAKIRVEPMEGETNQGLLGAYEIVAMPGETNRLPLLIGPKYAVSAEAAFGSFGLVPPPFVPLAEDTGTVERLTFGDAFSATNVTDRLVEVQWPVKFALEEIDATPAATKYALRVTPDWLDGVLTWHGIDDTNAPPMRGAPPTRGSDDSCSCGCLSLDGDYLIHSVSCTCASCYADGELVYEAYSIYMNFDMKHTSAGDSHSDVESAYQEMRPRPSVSVSFDKDCVLFETPYENEPGVITNTAPSTTTKLTVSAYGGSNGILVTLEMLGGIDICPGEDSVGGFVPAYCMEQWEVQCKGIAASPNVNGAVALVRYNDLSVPESKMAEARTTSVEIALRPEDLINGCPNRHKVGVCETVMCLHYPTGAPVSWSMMGGGILRTGSNNAICYYDAPVLGTEADITATCGGEQYPTSITVIEPEGLWCSNHVTAIITNVPSGRFGGIGMKLQLYVVPLTVSFKNIAVEEVPCDRGVHTGYFGNVSFSTHWSHTYDMGAGRWNNIYDGNKFGEDMTTFGDWPLPWSDGELIWPIPIGWNVAGTEDGPPVKNFPVEYESKWTIFNDGTIKKSKHNHYISKTTNGVLRLDGVIVDGN